MSSIISNNRCAHATEVVELTALYLVMQLDSYLSRNSSSPSLLRYKPKTLGGECRSHMFFCHKFCFNFFHLNLHLYWKSFLGACMEFPDGRRGKRQIQVPSLSAEDYVLKPGALMCM